MLNQGQNFEDKKAETRRLSTQEGAVASVMAGAGEAYIIPFALELKASNFLISQIASLGGLLGPLGQIIGSRLVEKIERKKLVYLSVLTQSLIWLLFVAVGLSFFFFHEIPFITHILLLVYLAYVFSGSLGGPAWFSIMGDAVPEEIRGSYFSHRNRIAGIINISANVAAATLLFYTRQWGYIIFGFMALFVVSSLARYTSARLIRRHWAPPIVLEKEYYFSFWQFARRAPSNNFGRFTIYVALMSAALNVSGPFFGVYLWRDLALNPVVFMMVNVSAGFFAAWLLPLWGKFADRYGNRELLRLGSLLMIPVPLFWTISTNPWYFILGPQLLMGAAWAAFSLAAGNFIFDSVTPQRRAICVAYHNLFNGTGVFLGATLGGLAAQFISISFMNSLFVVFIASAVIRLIVHFVFLRRVTEVRTVVAKPASNPLYYLKEVRPLFNLAVERVYPRFGFSLSSRRLRQAGEEIIPPKEGSDSSFEDNQF